MLLRCALFQSAFAECGVYLAQSTIAGAGLGTYAGKFYDVGSSVGQPSIVIPINDMHKHQPDSLKKETFFDSYTWGLDAFNHMADEGKGSGGFIPGAGTAMNYMLPLVNVVGMNSLIEMSSGNLHRSKDPGVGAFTPFYNRQMIAEETIDPGSELFDSYGEGYFIEREAIFGKIPLEADYINADLYLERLVGARNELCLRHKVCENGTNEIYKELYRDWIGLHTEKLSLVWPSRVWNALPSDPAQLDNVLQLGTRMKDYNNSMRSLAWLEQHGDCADNLIVGPSTIDSQAGRGAFAKRPIPNGRLIGPAPVLHVKKSLLEMHPIVMDVHGAHHINTSSASNHYQLLLNYCFGHPQSSILLCPYGFDTSLINHSKSKPNAKLVWNRKLTQHPEWLEQPLEQWVDEFTSGLVIDFIAIRDIQPGEEILIDYGDEWEMAWKRHVSTWQPPVGAEDYIMAAELNEREVIPTVHEQSHHRNEEYVHLYCRDIYRRWSGLRTADKKDKSTVANANSYSSFVSCRAVNRFIFHGETMYTAELFTRATENGKTEDRVTGVLFMMPRDAFFFQDKPYSRE